MTSKLKRKLSLGLILAMLFSIQLPVFASETPVNANGLVLSTNSIGLSTDTSATVTAALPEGMDASRLTYFVADPSVVTVTPVGAMGNVAAFQFSYAGNGMTTVAILHADNPAVVGYISVTSAVIIMDIPTHLGTNHDNYCDMVNYTIEPYDFKWADFNDYKYTLKFNFKCTSYEDEDFSRWGCFGYFYDANGNIISKVHLYASALSLGRTYKDECNVPVNAVRFSIEGF